MYGIYGKCILLGHSVSVPIYNLFMQYKKCNTIQKIQKKIQYKKKNANWVPPGCSWSNFFFIWQFLTTETQEISKFIRFLINSLSLFFISDKTLCFLISSLFSSPGSDRIVRCNCSNYKFDPAKKYNFLTLNQSNQGKSHITLK